MGQFKLWDYKKPYFYLVTLKRLAGLPPLAKLDPTASFGIDRTHPLTRALSEEINAFQTRSPGIESIKPFIIMPDHIHLLIKIKDIPERKSLKVYVSFLKGFLRRRFRKETGLDTLLFEKDWHDLIVKKAKQLNNFNRYICNNPQMALLRQAHREKFYCYRDYRHWRLGDAPCDLVGNPELLDEPAFLAVKVSRSVLPGSLEWTRLEAFYENWRPGATAVGTWWSKGEQMAYQKILANGGNIIVLCPDGFGECWHPTGEQAQALCAEGRLLYLSPYPAHAAKLPTGETRARCVALNALARQMEAATVTA